LLFRSSGKAWQPNKNSRICSLHFEGGKRSEDPRTTAYNPTIFPNIYRKRNVENSQRAERVKRRQRKVELMHPVALQHEEGLIVSYETTKTTSEAVVEASLNMNSVMTQTDLDTSPENNVSFMYCWQDPSTNEASTQTCINVNKPENRPKKVIVVAPQLVQTETVGVGPDCDMRPGFIGFDDIKTDSDMKQLAGVSLSMFQIFLAFIKPLTHRQPKYYKVMNA